jgi:hypothetical protein
MKHATPAGLDRLEPLLNDLRKIDGLKEKSRGVFYRGSRAFLHFHEHGDAFFADLRAGDDFERFPSTGRADQVALIGKVRFALGGAKKNAKRTG